jgi:epsin
VRQKAKAVTALLTDNELLAAERSNRNHMTNRRPSHRSSDGDLRYGTAGRRRSATNTSNYSGSHRGGGEDDDEMRRAIEESKRTAEEEKQRRGKYTVSKSSDDDLQKALRLSEQEAASQQRKVAVQNERMITSDVVAINSHDHFVSCDVCVGTTPSPA